MKLQIVHAVPLDPQRRRSIVEAYANLPLEGSKADECINFVKRTCRCRSISHFLDSAKESNIIRLERMLKS